VGRSGLTWAWGSSEKRVDWCFWSKWFSLAWRKVWVWNRNPKNSEILGATLFGHCCFTAKKMIPELHTWWMDCWVFAPCSWGVASAMSVMSPLRTTHLNSGSTRLRDMWLWTPNPQLSYETLLVRNHNNFRRKTDRSEENQKHLGAQNMTKSTTNSRAWPRPERNTWTSDE